MKFTSVNEENRSEVTTFICEQWLTSKMIIRGNIVDMTLVDGIIVYEKNKIIALLTYVIDGGTCEIVSLDSLSKRRGIGTELVQQVIEIARKKGCSRVIVVTTNDNINAIHFYQKRGFDMAQLYHNALDVSRKLKPEIPLYGEDGIRLQHEIEFELKLVGQEEV